MTHGTLYKIFFNFQEHDFLDFLPYLCISAFLQFGAEKFMSQPGITPESKMRRPPKQRKISMRSAVHHIAGPEQDYPTYRFSGRIFLERPKHNPFEGL